MICKRQFFSTSRNFLLPFGKEYSRITKAVLRRQLRSRSRAMKLCEPCQAGNRAALSGMFHVPRGNRLRSCVRRTPSVSGRRRTFSYHSPRPENLGGKPHPAPLRARGRRAPDASVLPARRDFRMAIQREAGRGSFLGGEAVYQALYRKWRPKAFADVIVQEQITGTLSRKVRAGPPMPTSSPGPGAPGKPPAPKSWPRP